MKKTLISILVIITMLPFNAFTQSAPTLDVQKLEITTSPVYVVLGIQPTNIMRPSTPRDFAASIENFYVNGVVQPGLAMEVNPFNWIKDKKVNSHIFNSNDYFDKNIWPSIKKNFALSFATSNTDTTTFGSLKKGTGLGFGFRVTILPGTVNKKSYDYMFSWNLLVIKNVFISFLRNDSTTNDPSIYISKAKESTEIFLQNTKNAPLCMKNDIYKQFENYTREFSDIKNRNELLSKIKNNPDKFKLDSLQLLVADSLSKIKIPFARDGFILELAGAGLYHLQDNLWTNAVFAKSGLWLTPSYRVDLSKGGTLQSLDFLGVIRYLWNDSRVDVGNYFDTGLKLQFNRNKWNASLEGISRYASHVPIGINSNWTYSWITNFSYLITDDISFRFSFGSNFNGNTSTYSKPNGIIAMGGLNFAVF